MHSTVPYYLTPNPDMTLEHHPFPDRLVSQIGLHSTASRSYMVHKTSKKQLTTQIRRLRFHSWRRPAIRRNATRKNEEIDRNDIVFALHCVLCFVFVAQCAQVRAFSQKSRATCFRTLCKETAFSDLLTPFPRPILLCAF